MQSSDQSRQRGLSWTRWLCASPHSGGARERMRVTGLDRTLLVFPTVAGFRAWNGGSGTQPDGGGVLTGG